MMSRSLESMLADADFLRGMGYRDVEVVAKYFQTREVSKGEVIFKQGGPGSFMLFLCQGKVEVLKEADNQAKVVSVVEEGSVLGEMALIEGELRSATCKALDNGVIATLNHIAFERMQKENLAVSFKFLMCLARLVSRRLRMTTDKLRK